MDAESFARLERLTTRPDEAVADILERGLAKLGGVTTAATFELRLPSADAVTGFDRFTLRLGPPGPSLLTGHVDNPSLVATMSHEVFRQLVDGTYPPAQAYLDGAVELQGDLALAREVVGRLRAPGTGAAVCPLILLDEGYSPVNGGGTLSIVGLFFSPNGPVELVLDYGLGTIAPPLPCPGSQSARCVQADANGTFSWEAEGVPCGDMLKTPGVGAVVSAVDLLSGRQKTQNFPTPC